MSHGPFLPGDREESGGNLAEATWPNPRPGGNPAGSNLAGRVRSGSISNLASLWAIPNLANFPIRRISQSEEVNTLAVFLITRAWPAGLGVTVSVFSKL